LTSAIEINLSSTTAGGEFREMRYENTDRDEEEAEPVPEFSGE
jgi:hypothetical protein